MALLTLLRYMLVSARESVVAPAPKAAPPKPKGKGGKPKVAPTPPKGRKGNAKSMV